VSDKNGIGLVAGEYVAAMRSAAAKIRESGEGE
jgi:hypothetical protein